MRRERSPFDGLDQSGMNGVADGIDRGGALGLSHDKMALVREKKEEIEKVIVFPQSKKYHCFVKFQFHVK